MKRNPSPAAPGASPRERIRHHATQFHRNFNAGDFDKNGALVAENIYVDSNNTILMGRENFVNRIRRYSGPFPGLQLVDRIIVVEGNVAAVHYVLQGRHTGTAHGAAPAKGHNIQAYSGEVFEFDAQGLMRKLTTITQLDQVMAQALGERIIAQPERYAMRENEARGDDAVAAARQTLTRLHLHFNAGEFDAMAALFDPAVVEDRNGELTRGRDAVVAAVLAQREGFSGLTLNDEYVLVEGHRGAIEYNMVGVHDGKYTAPNGCVLPPTQKAVRVRGIQFFELSREGLIASVITVSNRQDFVQQIVR